MPNNLVQQIEYIAGAGYLNTVNDAAIGGMVNTLTGAAYFGGQLGCRIAVDHATAAKLSDTANVGTLYGGIYQYVQTKSGSSTAPARGLAAFFASSADLQSYIVTPDVPTNGGCLAGFYISAPTKGYYCWIQIRGLAGVKFHSSITRATPAAQDMVYLTSGGGVGDEIEDATAITDAFLRRAVGIAAEAPVASEVKLVELWDRFLNV